MFPLKAAIIKERNFRRKCWCAYACYTVTMQL